MIGYVALAVSAVLLAFAVQAWRQAWAVAEALNEADR
jgi:hypothetical protein